jgi:hypothetical protein
MQALNDEQQLERMEGRLERIEGRLDRLETKVDGGFAEVRGELGALHRLMVQLFAGSSVTMILGFAGIILSHS